MNDIKPSDKKALFEKLLDLLKVFDEVCAKHNIKYYAYGGTMLGAIRHGGFIPWDDDIDVAMPRSDYNKLRSLAENGKVFSFPYFFQNPSTDQGFPKGYCRLRNCLTTEIPYVDVYEKCNHGIFIDIFPLDVLPNSQKKIDRQIKKLKIVRTAMNSYSRWYSGVGTLGISKIKRLAYYFSVPLFKIHLINMKKLYSIYEKIASQYSKTNYGKIGSVAGTLSIKRFIYDRKLWKYDTKSVRFESMEIPVPKSYDLILTHTYGDYMVPVHESSNHGNTLFSADIPYEQFNIINKDKLMKERYALTSMGKKNKMKFK